MEAMLEDKNFDVVVVGTGPVQSVVAAALARVGKKVLHLDPNGYYGGCYGTLQVLDLINYLVGAPPRTAESAPAAEPPSGTVPLRLDSANLILSATSTVHIPLAPPCASPACRASVGKRPCYSPSCPFVARKGARPRPRLSDEAPVHTWVDVTLRARQYNIDLIPKVRVLVCVRVCACTCVCVWLCV
jgi:RAB protein geranylgeranyltransferase component A